MKSSLSALHICTGLACFRAKSSVNGDNARSMKRGRRLDYLTLLISLALSALTVYEVREHSHGYSLRQKPIIEGFTPHWPVESVEDELFRLLNAPQQLDACNAEENVEYQGELVKWDTDRQQRSAEECCSLCSNTEGCNVWVWCARLTGCGPERKYRECWLKRANPKDIIAAQGFPNPAVGWTSGAIFPEAIRDAITQAQQNRTKALLGNFSLPLVYFDVAISGLPLGRVVAVLYSDVAPLAAENIRALCTGEKGVVPEGRPTAGNPYHLKGSSFYRIVDRFIDQTGTNTDSIYGGVFPDDEGGLALSHDRRGLLSMANNGPDSNGAHFSFLMNPARHLDGKYVVFGEVLSGMEVLRQVNSLARDKENGQAGAEEGAVILDSGQLDRNKVLELGYF